MNEKEFIAEIQRRVRAQRLAKGGFVKRFAQGGWLGVDGSDVSRNDSALGMAEGFLSSGVASTLTGAADAIANGGNAGDAIRAGISGGTMGMLDGLLYEGDPVRNKYETTDVAQGTDWKSQMDASSANVDRAMAGMGAIGTAQEQLGVNMGQLGANVGGLQGQIGGLGSQIGTAANRLEQRALGQGPSIADMQMRQGMQANAANAASIAASARGVNPALAARMAGQQASGANAQMAGAAMQGRLAEQQQAEGQLAGARAQQAGLIGQSAAVYGQQGDILNSQANLLDQRQKGTLGAAGVYGDMYGKQAAGASSDFATTTKAETEREQIDATTAENNAVRAAENDHWYSTPWFSGGQVPRRFESGGGVPFFPGNQNEPFYEPLDVSAGGGYQQPAAESGRPDFSGSAHSEDFFKPFRAAEDPGVGQSFAAGVNAATEAAKSPGSSLAKAASGKKSMDGMWPFIMQLAMKALVGKKMRGGRTYRADGGEIEPSPEIPNYFWGALVPILKGVAGSAISSAMSDDEKKNYSSNYGAYDDGGTVPGSASIPGDDIRNDKQPAMLSPGEIVLPRSVTMDESAPEMAAGFVKGIQASKEQERQSAQMAEGGGVLSQNFEQLKGRQADLAKKAADYLAAPWRGAGDPRPPQSVGDDAVARAVRDLASGNGPTGKPTVNMNDYTVSIDGKLTGRRGVGQSTRYPREESASRDAALRRAAAALVASRSNPDDVGAGNAAVSSAKEYSDAQSALDALLEQFRAVSPEEFASPEEIEAGTAAHYADEAKANARAASDNDQQRWLDENKERRYRAEDWENDLHDATLKLDLPRNGNASASRPFAKGGMVGKPNYERLMKRQAELARKIAELGTELDKK